MNLLRKWSIRTVMHHIFLNSEESASTFSGKVASATVITLSEIEPLNYSFCIHKMIEIRGGAP